MGMFKDKPLHQYKKPEGDLGKEIIASMNESHFDLTSWGLSNIEINENDMILDIGCGGGRTVSRLSKLASKNKTYGIDYSAECVKSATEFNSQEVKKDKVEIINASVDELPFEDGKLDKVFAVETTYFWPSIKGGFKEIARTIKHGGELVIINEAYTSLNFKERNDAYWEDGKMKIFSPKEFKNLLIEAGFSNVDIFLNPTMNWITCVATK